MFGFLLVALAVGALLPIQAGVNAQLRTALGDPVATALVSFLVGTAGLLALVVGLQIPVPMAGAWMRSTWWQWAGGLLGAIYIAAAVVLAPRLGAATLIAAVVAGQLVSSLVLDHFGWFGFAQHSINWARLLGAALIMLGVLLMRR